MSSYVPEAAGRTARTAIQLVPSAVVVEFVDAFAYDMNDRQYAALAALLLLMFTYAQNALEDYKQKGWWFRRVPPTNVPVKGE